MAARHALPGAPGRSAPAAARDRRRTGRELVFPVAYRDNGDGRLLVLTNSPWRVDLRDRPDVTVTLAGRRRPAQAQLVEEPERVAEAARRDALALVHRTVTETVR
ncbi:hypothetical protein MRQ36_31085 [Micromonospora sp. R77]|uniref:hypothetical protein n=1 Tax=Micromonospora sp. R77 TaxID=2925836 RepID=UPI001F61B1C4|nr:hypothetical protein [Micromonospora sp. R77]MCI4066765.1 hypothetical protein [Micromonospora sp. R77]